jgi:Na+-transporting methylmalonyl-CoA/oxaloacetate decarboxylase gamma subunit
MAAWEDLSASVRADFGSVASFKSIWKEPPAARRSCTERISAQPREQASTHVESNSLIFTVESPFAEGMKTSRAIATSGIMVVLGLSIVFFFLKWRILVWLWTIVSTLEAISTLSAKNDDDVQKIQARKEN